MKDSGEDTWSNGAWISIEGINGNLVFKQMMTARITEDYLFSLYSPINKGSTWKYTANASGTWTTIYYDDQRWSEVQTGMTAQSATGTQYFRHTFIGSANFTAVEVQLNYRYGVIAYVNGVEIYRDNMPEGPATPSTTANNSYNTTSYHGIIRSADVVEHPTVVLAVEVHFTDVNHEEILQFNGFLSLMVGISTDNNCFVLPQTPSIGYSTFHNELNAFDWSLSSYSYSYAEDDVLTVDFSSIPSLGVVNGFRVWPSTNPTSTLGVFSVNGSHNSDGPYSEVFARINTTYVSNTWKQFLRVTPVGRYEYLRIGNAGKRAEKRLYEVQFMVCNTPSPSVITYTQAKTSYLRHYESVDVRPDHYGFSNCQIRPFLPSGLMWDRTTCSVSGISTETSDSQVYTVTATVGTIQATGTITLAFTDCANSLYKIVRTYQSSPQNEYFRIYDTSNNNIIYDVTQGHLHNANVDWTYYLCISQERFDIVFYNTDNYWQSNSYFYMYYELPNGEQEMVVKGRYDNLVSAVNNHYLRRPVVEHSQEWYYNFDSVPIDWYSSDVSSDWREGSRGNFGSANNKIQLFKKLFNVNSLSEVKGVILSLRFRYGCVVYLNGHEAFRNGVTGNVTSNPIATNAYTDIKYRVVTLPGKTIPTTAQPTAVNYLRQGQNTIAIALVALTDTQTIVEFDSVVRLMAADQSESHIWEFAAGDTKNMTGKYHNPFSQIHNKWMYWWDWNACTSNYLEFTLADDRREWVSSMHIQNDYRNTGIRSEYPTQFKVYARNPEDTDWTLLKEVEDLIWSVPGQKHKVYFQNNKSYNQFRFENIFPANHASECRLTLQSLDLYSDNVMTELAPLTYPGSLQIFKDIEMSEVIPAGEGFFDFTITPSLPSGINLNPQTGWISGTASNINATQTYTISAHKVTGGMAAATISIAVDECIGDRSLMTVRFRADSYMSENSWKLYKGRGTAGPVLQQVQEFPVKSNYYYVDFCLENGLYTLEAQDSFGDGWQPNTGYTLTADLGSLELEIQEMAPGTAPVKVSSVFSTYFPFQFGKTEWKINQSGFVEGWTGISFDDTMWMTKKASEIPTTEKVTTYIRKTFDLTSIADYQVLNIRLKYTGGVACYLNGNMVGLINMDEGFDANTEPQSTHEFYIDGKFHIILHTAGIVEGINVIAFEIHQFKRGIPEPVVFDATGVFGVDDCSVVIDSFWTRYKGYEENINGVMDLDPYTTGTLNNDVGDFIEWTVDNVLGSKWNKFNIHTGDRITSWGFSISGNFNRETGESEKIPLFRKKALNFDGRERNNFDVPAALAGFRTYRWEVIATSTPKIVVNSIYQVYCKANGAICPAIDNYPSVGEGQISPAPCPEGYTGYSYRVCSGGKLGEILLDKCALNPPSDAQYSLNHYQFVKETKVTTGIPSVKGLVSKWFIDNGVILPEGLTLNEKNGEISGIPMTTQDITTYTIFAENGSGVTSAKIHINVRVGQCKAEGVFPVTEVGEVAVYKCSTERGYIGTQKRACKMGEVDGEWQWAIGFCMTIALAVVLITMAILTIMIMVFIVLRITRKAKAVGGLKGRKQSTRTSKLKKKGKSNSTNGKEEKKSSRKNIKI